MKYYLHIAVTILALLTVCSGMADSPTSPLIAYCSRGATVSPDENKIIQATVANFSQKMDCQIGNNCLLKWYDHGTPKFSIAWAAVCHPERGVGDNGRGSTFVCQHDNNGKICCSPLGFPAFTVCNK